MDNCIFCKIVRGDIPAKIVYRDETVVAFHDISPAAPIHVLFIPVEHIVKLSELSIDHANLIGEIHVRIAKVAAELGLQDYRVVSNCGESVGQSVFHIHFHLLGGRKMGWPPG
ncbi:MAG: histidine triad nucleotide-binding protein [bacterium]|nr:histidine triad nucleotide-binding protein [bacterium]